MCEKLCKKVFDFVYICDYHLGSPKKEDTK